MDFAALLATRFSVMNPRRHARFTPIHTHPDGHGTYEMTVGDKHKNIVINPAEAKGLSHGRNNKNLDNQLRL